MPRQHSNEGQGLMWGHHTRPICFSFPGLLAPGATMNGCFKSRDLFTRPREWGDFSPARKKIRAELLNATKLILKEWRLTPKETFVYGSPK